MPSSKAVSVAILAFAVILPCRLAAPISDWFEGQVANFGGPADNVDPNEPSGGLVDGACGFGAQDRGTWPNWRVAAIAPNNPLFADASRLPKQGCGACIEIECTDDRCTSGAGAPLVVQVVDECRDCDANRLVIPFAIFRQSLGSAIGEADIRFRQVDCEPDGNIVVDVDQFRTSDGGYARLALKSVAGSGDLTSVELRRSPSGADGAASLSDGAGWLPMENTYGARWEISGVGGPPLDVRITSGDGEVIIATAAIDGDTTGEYPTSVQVGGPQAPPSPSPAPAPSPAPPSPAETTQPEEPSAPTPPLVTVPSTPSPPVPVPPPAPSDTGDTCTDTIVDAARALPELSRTVENIEATNLGPLLADASQEITLFAPTNEAWEALDALDVSVDLDDRQTLQSIMTYLVVTGSVNLPASSTFLPEDAEDGVTVPIDTLQGAPLTAIAAISGEPSVTIQDNNPVTEDGTVVTAVQVCNSFVIVVDTVPLPF